jgi:hypothetical protein
VTTQYRPPYAVTVVIVVIALILAGVIVAMAEEGTSVVAKDDATVWVYPRIPSEEEKAAAIRKAYELNGNSMVGWYMLDLSQPEPPPVTVRTIPIEPPKKRERR